MFWESIELDARTCDIYLHLYEYSQGQSLKADLEDGSSLSSTDKTVEKLCLDFFCWLAGGERA